ncbi:hypothetical protein GCM10009682_47490 [Luedemannella flava]|uniref:General secretion pathway protein GspM n=2 Tax=Luedemannella flava TaxID=349316 RepID=A0ABN2MDE1_9ACTN
MRGWSWSWTASRLWAVGGAAAALLALAISWFVLIHPRYSETAQLEEDIAAAEQRLVADQRRLSKLRIDHADLGRFRSELETNREALPTTPATSDFLRELQSAANKTGASVDSLAVGDATPVPGVAAVSSLRLTLTLSGTPARLDAFVHEVRLDQPRAALVDSVNLLRNGTGKKGILTVSVQVFVTEPLGGTD